MKNLPVVGICGWNKSGKTALIESVLPELREKGIHTAVVKHLSHEYEMDRRGKDSARLFQHKTDVYLHTPSEIGVHAHKTTNFSLERDLRELSRRYDFILVEGYKHSPVPKFWLTDASGRVPKDLAEPIVEVLTTECDRHSILLKYIESSLSYINHQTPIYGCVLIGGKSQRMGAPKHLLEYEGKTWLERIIAVLQHKTEKNVIVGKGDLPETLKDTLRLPDIEECSGPMAGILSAMRWAPYASWIVCACDLPWISPASLDWLCRQRQVGRWIVMPSIPKKNKVEPLYAFYEFRAASFVEKQVAEGNYKLSDLAKHPNTIVKIPPDELQSSWFNVNSNEDLAWFYQKTNQTQ